MRTLRAAFESPCLRLHDTIVSGYVRSFCGLRARESYHSAGDVARKIMSMVEGFGNWLNNLVISIRSVLRGATRCRQAMPAQQR